MDKTSIRSSASSTNRSSVRSLKLPFSSSVSPAPSLVNSSGVSRVTEERRSPSPYDGEDDNDPEIQPYTPDDMDALPTTIHIPNAINSLDADPGKGGLSAIEAGIAPIPSAGKGDRFSINSNLMNYSIPKTSQRASTIAANARQSQTLPRSLSVQPTVPIQSGEQATRIRLLENQIESLTMQNIKLQRTNRLLKVDADKFIKESTQALENEVATLRAQNVRFQRLYRLTKAEYEQLQEDMREYKAKEIQRMRHAGPEYEYLVQMINLLQHQVHGDIQCNGKCVYTDTPITAENVIMTAPPDGEGDHSDLLEQHICRPVISSWNNGKSMTAKLTEKVSELEAMLEKMDEVKSELLRQLEDKDVDLDMLKRELVSKDRILAELEDGFISLQKRIGAMQPLVEQNASEEGKLRDSLTSNASSMSTTSTNGMQNDTRMSSPSTEFDSELGAELNDLSTELTMKRSSLEAVKRRSQILMSNKRNSLRMAADDELLDRLLLDHATLEKDDSEVARTPTRISVNTKALPEEEMSVVTGEPLVTSPVDEATKSEPQTPKPGLTDVTQAEDKSKPEVGNAESPVPSSVTERKAEPISADDKSSSSKPSDIAEQASKKSSKQSRDERRRSAILLRHRSKRALIPSFMSSHTLPATFPQDDTPSLLPAEAAILQKDPFAPFSGASVFLSTAALLNVTEDWTAPLVLALWIGLFMWSGAAEGIQLQLASKERTKKQE
ncbi:hypothetical protein BZG36_01915 [Bifiguratus adelaidae]|uniref:Uncharacterized protein n=1 Tax=Bifiguratus adelaidae TaxID=1938954 RepID=A0A261Y4E6_9FUNG|nr:hypothetical protein BZG36_01915 [Bifiguratus adelaidae]